MSGIVILGILTGYVGMGAAIAFNQNWLILPAGLVCFSIIGIGIWDMTP